MNDAIGVFVDERRQGAAYPGAYAAFFLQLAQHGLLRRLAGLALPTGELPQAGQMGILKASGNEPAAVTMDEREGDIVFWEGFSHNTFCSIGLCRSSLCGWRFRYRSRRDFVTAAPCRMGVLGNVTRFS